MPTWSGKSKTRAYLTVLFVLVVAAVVGWRAFSDRSPQVVQPKWEQLGPFQIPKQAEAEQEGAWRAMRKGIAELHRRTQVSQACNERYLEALAMARTPPRYDPSGPVRDSRPSTQQSSSALSSGDRNRRDTRIACRSNPAGACHTL